MKYAYDHPGFDCISNENIRTAIDMAERYFADNGVDESNKIRSRLFLEDVLLQYQKQDESAPFELVLERSFRKVTVTLLVKSKSFNAMEVEEEFFIQSSSRIETFEMPIWKYRHRRNVIRFDISVKMPNRKTVQYVIRYMDSEKRAFRLGLLMRF